MNKRPKIIFKIYAFVWLILFIIYIIKMSQKINNLDIYKIIIYFSLIVFSLMTSLMLFRKSKDLNSSENRAWVRILFGISGIMIIIINTIMLFK